MANMAVETLTSTSEGGPPSGLPGTTAEEEFCRSLPRQDPIAAQKFLCEALSRFVSNREPDDRQLSALLSLDRHAHQISKRLLVQYGEGDAQLRSLDRRVFISAQRLSRSFAQAYELYLGHVENSADKSWRESASTVLVRLFRHRQVELLLRLFRYKKRNSEQWRQLHRSYQFAQVQGLVNDSMPRSLPEDKSAPEQTVEQQFIQILLVGAMNTGQFSPRELLWASNWIARWRSLLTLQSADANGATPGERNGFVVDLHGAEGLKRFYAGESGDFLHLDTAPLMGAIDKEVAALNDAPTAPNSPVSTERDGRGVLLSKLRMLFAPDLIHIKRRGDRKPVAFSVQAISGLAHIVQVLREEVHGKTRQTAASATQVEEITIAPASGHTRMMSTSVLGAADLAPLSIATTFGANPQTWQVKDRSDSGCRMRGQTTDLNGLIPGSLIAIREGENAQWTVAVVRRLRRLMVDHVEISVEHIGRKPRFVKVATDYHPEPYINDVPNKNTQRCLGALYLPASERHPTMPIKTLLVPASVFNAGRAITLLSSTAIYTLRLNKPLEQQSGFVWTSFALIDKVLAPSRRMQGATAISR
jgi:cyclic-di-GMP-binding protein